MNLAELKAKKSPLEFELDGETIKAEFYPHKLTPEYRASLQRPAQDDGGENFDIDAKMVSELLVKWDVMAGDEPYPPTYENLINAPQSLVTRVAAEIINAVGKLTAPKTSKR